MKKIIASFLCVIFALSFLCACGKSEKTVREIKGNKEILAKFSSLPAPESILDEVSGIDLKHKMNTAGMTKETQVDPEDDSLKINMYYDKTGKLIYKEFEGYSEKYFIHYTKSKSGDELEVSYSYGYYANNSIRDVDCKAENYSVHFYETSDNSEYGAINVQVNEKSKTYGKMEESISYILREDCWTFECSYLADDGLHRYGSEISEEGKIEEYDYILFSEKNDVKETNVKEIYDYFGDEPVHLEMCMNRAPFYSEKEGEVKWHYATSFNVFFDDKESADAFASRFGGEVTLYDEDEMTYVVIVSDITVGISDDFKDFDPYDYSEIDDMYSAIPEFDDDWKVVSLKGGYYSYY